MKLSKRVKDILRPLYYLVAHRHVRDSCLSTKWEYQAFYKKHEGNCCFIVANGPSLKMEDLDTLHKKKIMTFAMNRIYKIYDKTRWRPTYYVTQDPTIIRTSYAEICDLVSESVVFEKSPGEKRYDIPNAVYYDIDYSRSWKGLMPCFSDGTGGILFDGKTVTYSALQLAVYMGFNKIYLIGCDCNYSKTNQITAESYPDARMFEKGKMGSIPDIDYQIMSYAKAKEYAESHGVEIYNATRGGMLEVFKRVDFDKIMEEM